MRCADMIQGRRRHGAAFVSNTTVYALGGWVSSKGITLENVEQYNTIKNKWTTVGQLTQCVQCAGCVAYKSSIYLFGGNDENRSTDKDEYLDCIQQYDTTTQQSTMLPLRLPCRSLLHAVLWAKSVILADRSTCLVFDLNQQTLEQRNQFAVGVSHFGLVVDNQTLFVIGGGNIQTDRNGATTWTCTDEVKCIPVMDIINNELTVKWTRHTKLQSPQLVQAFAQLTLPTVQA